MRKRALILLAALAAISMGTALAASIDARSSVARVDSVERRPADTDGDGVIDILDNCSEIANADQRDTDVDSFGNRCDPDFDQNLSVNFSDLVVMKAAFFGTDPDVDLDGSGMVNFTDLSIMKAFFFGPPGPGAVVTSYATHVQPILGVKCAGCHTGAGAGDHNIGSDYADAFLAADDFDECAGLNIAECALVLIQLGEMPRGAGCTGNPDLDAGNPECLTRAEQDTLQAWIDDGLQP